MKRILYTSALVLGALFCDAQSVTDGLLYGQQDDLYGTARYRALSGAFGALGGDLSAMSQNPAGSAIFSNHYASFSIGYNDKQNRGSYFGTVTDSDEQDLNFGQFGGVLVFKSIDESLLTKFSIGLNYDNTRNYDNNSILRGVADTSISQYFINNANGFTIDNFETQRGESVSDLYRFLGEQVGFDAQQGLLGFQAFVINPVDPTDPNNASYTSATGTGNFTQISSLSSAGSQSKTSFNVAGQFANRWSIGLNLNGHFIDYTRLDRFTEANSNVDASTRQVDFENLLDVNGSGFSFQIGAIGNITESLRVGATYESPTWYDIEETLLQEISTTRVENGQSIFEDVRPDVLNVYLPYNLRTPGSVTGSIAYVFGTKGLLSLDYSSRDYSNLEFENGVSNNFDQNNAFISQNLQRANTLRIGGEYRIERFTLRGGFRQVDSPYQDKTIIGDLTGYSAGLGYNWGNTVLDISYDYAQRDSSEQLFSGGVTNRGFLQTTQHNVVATLGFNF